MELKLEQRHQSQEIRPDPVASSRHNFENLLAEIGIIFGRADKTVNVDQLCEVLERYRSNAKEWSKYAFYEKYRYKRNFVDGNELYNIMILTWAPGTKSCIHDHPNAHCFMKLLDGELVESRFAWPNQSDTDKENCEMRLVSESKASTNDILYINDNFGLHCVENPSQTKSCVSLHIYCPPFRMCKAFDRSTGASQVCQLSFHSERGRLIGENRQDGETS